MTTLRASRFSKRPDAAERTPVDLEAFLRARNRSQLHQFLLRAFMESGMTRADLAKRTGKKPEVISRLLGRPSNLTVDTFCEVLFAINGMAPKYSSYDPLANANAGRNHDHRPDWAEPPLEKITTQTSIVVVPTDTSTDAAVNVARELEWV